MGFRHVSRVLLLVVCSYFLFPLLIGCTGKQESASANRTITPSSQTVPVSAGSADRFALVIGNGNYRNLDTLLNPVNDASDIASSLKNLGWSVDLRSNLNNVDMGKAISTFMQKLKANKTNKGFSGMRVTVLR